MEHFQRLQGELVCVYNYNMPFKLQITPVSLVPWKLILDGEEPKLLLK